MLGGAFFVARPRTNEPFGWMRTSATDVLALTMPPPSGVATFDAQDYTIIDFQMIDNRWASLVQTGRTLTITFRNGASIELLNFFSAESVSAPDSVEDTASTQGRAETDIKVRVGDEARLLS